MQCNCALVRSHRALAAAGATACGKHNAAQISYCISCLLQLQLIVSNKNTAHPPQCSSVEVLLQHGNKTYQPEVVLPMGRISCQLHLRFHEIPGCLQDASVLSRVVRPAMPTKIHFALPDYTEGCRQLSGGGVFYIRIAAPRCNCRGRTCPTRSTASGVHHAVQQQGPQGQQFLSN